MLLTEGCPLLVMRHSKTLDGEPVNVKLTKRKAPNLMITCCVAVVAALIAGILLADRASAKSNKGKPVKVSSDLRGQNSGGDNVDVIIQLNSTGNKPSL